MQIFLKNFYKNVSFDIHFDGIFPIFQVFATMGDKIDDQFSPVLYIYFCGNVKINNCEIFCENEKTKVYISTLSNAKRTLLARVTGCDFSFAMR